MIDPSVIEAREECMAKELRRGDRVEWNFGRGKAVGVVKRKLTSPTTIGKQRVAATPHDPRYLVRTDSGKEAAHTAAALRKIDAR
jgi:Hypervirulence associated proteins TUDOR domain